MADIDELRQILDLMRQHELSEFELEREGFKIKVKKTSAGHNSHLPAVGPPPLVPASAVAPPPAPSLSPVAASPEPVTAASEEELELAVLKSPIVGTFYRSAEPGAPPFVETGDMVRKGQVVCIIEAMKLLNEIESDHDGELTNIYVDNGQPVQYGERLFAIKVK
jgi:acetyl-CoA carboxylase biotin carboxyl carrier protein